MEQAHPGHPLQRGYPSDDRSLDYGAIPVRMAWARGYMESDSSVPIGDRGRAHKALGRASSWGRLS